MLTKDKTIGFGERVCPTCGQLFLLTSPLKDYTYKIKINDSNTLYFCRYTHYKAGLKKWGKKDGRTRNDKVTH